MIYHYFHFPCGKKKIKICCSTIFIKFFWTSFSILAGTFFCLDCHFLQQRNFNWRVVIDLDSAMIICLHRKQGIFGSSHWPGRNFSFQILIWYWNINIGIFGPHMLQHFPLSNHQAVQFNHWSFRSQSFITALIPAMQDFLGLSLFFFCLMNSILIYFLEVYWHASFSEHVQTILFCSIISYYWLIYLHFSLIIEFLMLCLLDINIIRIIIPSTAWACQLASFSLVCRQRWKIIQSI